MTLSPNMQAVIDRRLARRKALERDVAVGNGDRLSLKYSAELDVFTIRLWTWQPCDAELLACYDGRQSAQAVADFEALAS